MLSHFSDVVFFGVVGLGVMAIPALVMLASRTDANRRAYEGSRSEQFRDRVIAVSPALPLVVMSVFGLLTEIGQQEWYRLLATVALVLLVLGFQLPPMKRARDRLSSGGDDPAQ